MLAGLFAISNCSSGKRNGAFLIFECEYVSEAPNRFEEIQYPSKLNELRYSFYSVSKSDLIFSKVFYRFENAKKQKNANISTLSKSNDMELWNFDHR